jgi:hypothetical protein
MRLILVGVMMVSASCGDEVPPPTTEAGCKADPSDDNLPTPTMCTLPTCIETEGAASGLLATVEEDGHWSATAFDARASPFEVLSVQYLVAGRRQDADRNPNISHRVRFFSLGEDESPPPDPDILLEVVVPEGQVGIDDDRAVVVDLGEAAVSPTGPLRIEAGRRLFVMVEMFNGVNGANTLLLCPNREGGVDEGRTWWSNDVEPDYPWVPLADFGFSTSVVVGAVTRNG